jgi:hypothetical protein
MFSMGLYTLSNNGTSFNPQQHFFRIALQTPTSLLNCVSSKKKYFFVFKIIQNFKFR